MNSIIVLIIGIILVILSGYLYFTIEKYRNNGRSVNTPLRPLRSRILNYSK